MKKMKVVGYPEWLERWWIERACGHYGAARLEDCASRLEDGIQRLSNSFTTDRSETYSDYQDDPELALAYGLFYFPQNFVRVQFPLAELTARGWNAATAASLRIVDLGAGAGAAGFGAALQMQSAADIAIQGAAIDHSEAAIRVQQLIAANLRGQSWITLRADLRKGISFPPADLIVASFSMNELGINIDRFVDPLLQQLSPRGVLLILEPALKETSERLESLRDRVAAGKGYHVWAPCLHAEECPLLRDGEFWCHEVRRWTVPESVAYLNRRLHRSVDVLKFSFVAIGTAPPPASPSGPEHFRLISPFVKARGKWIGAGCASDGRRHEYEILKRDLTAESARLLQEVERGDVLHAEVREAGKTMRVLQVPRTPEKPAKPR